MCLDAQVASSSSSLPWQIDPLKELKLSFFFWFSFINLRFLNYWKIYLKWFSRSLENYIFEVSVENNQLLNHKTGDIYFWTCETGDKPKLFTLVWNLFSWFRPAMALLQLLSLQIICHSHCSVNSSPDSNAVAASPATKMAPSHKLSRISLRQDFLDTNCLSGLQNRGSGVSGGGFHICGFVRSCYPRSVPDAIVLPAIIFQRDGNDHF